MQNCGLVGLRLKIIIVILMETYKLKQKVSMGDLNQEYIDNNHFKS
jgi:hypothetical protein